MSKLKIQKFSFDTVKDFDNHISSSILGYDLLHSLILNISTFFIKDNCTIVDLGCTSGKLINTIKDRHKKEFDLPDLKLNFNCGKTGFGVTKKYWQNGGVDISAYAIGKEWDNVKVGGNSDKYFNLCKPSPDNPCFTITESSSKPTAASVVHPYQKRKLNIDEVRMLCTFPKDYDFLNTSPVSVMGRSVLPVMMANIANQIYIQWLSKLN